MHLYELAKGKRILLFDGFAKQSLPYLRSFKSFGCKVTVVCRSKLDCAYLSRLPDEKILCEYDYESRAYQDKLLTLVKSRKYDIVFPLFDATVKFFSHHKQELSPYAVIVANDREIFDAAFNKEEVMRVCQENGIPCPQTAFHVQTVDQIRQSEMKLPLIIKPHSMYGARGFHKFDTYDEMEDYVNKKGIHLTDYVIQEFIPETSRLMGANIYIDRNGEIKSSYLYICEHTYPEVGGTSTLNAILIREDIKEYCNKLVKLMGLRGEVGVDLMLDSRDKIGKVIEINVRPVHGISVGFFFGVDNGQQLLEDTLGLPVTPMEINRTDTAVRITQTDVLWFLKSPDRLRRRAKKLGYKHVKDQTFFWDDPGPWFAILADGLLNYRQKMAEKKQ